jgi:hypothetical protein
MKNYYFIAGILFIVFSCATKKAANFDKTVSTTDTIRISNEDLEYEVIIIDAGFNGWLATYGKNRNFYTQNYMKQRNIIWVTQWNQNVITGRQAELFLMSIDYDYSIDYGFEVDYLLYNYLTYFQLTNNIQLGGFKARL